MTHCMVNLRTYLPFCFWLDAWALIVSYVKVFSPFVRKCLFGLLNSSLVWKYDMGLIIKRSQF
uniref:Uncharacterized protein n=1 Tax=Anguilla anguilla TaxID=7936 RepID=A0A0E9W5D8_ANGAN